MQIGVAASAKVLLAANGGGVGVVDDEHSQKHGDSH
jgi:hypothetical protein